MLKALLPEAGTDIKGHMRSQQELLEASGYASRPKDFDELLRILDSEIRLITPTDPEGKDDADHVHGAGRAAKYYQLTHDYLVPSLRDWLTRKQKETRRGRAELLLADRAAVWNARPENRQLPSLWQWLQIRWLTREKDWTPPQRKMMGRAARHHAVRVLVVGVVLILAGLGRVRDARHHTSPGVARSPARCQHARRAGHRKRHGLVSPLARPAPARRGCSGRPSQRPPQTTPHQPGPAAGGCQHRSIPSTVGSGRQPHEVPVIRDALAPHQEDLLEKLWAVAEKPPQGKESQRLRAAAALAKYDPQSERWAKVSSAVVRDLVGENPVYLGPWAEAFRPVKHSLLTTLSDIFRDRSPERAAERTLATNLLAEYAADNPQVLPDLLMDADEKQFARLYPLVEQRSEACRSGLVGEIDPVPVAVAKDKVVLESRGVIADNDAKVKPSRGPAMPAKRFEVHLRGGKTYRLTMESKALDSFLVLQDQAAKELAFDDDSGGGLNSLLVYTAPKDDTYTVFAASLTGAGAFELKVVETVAGADYDATEKRAKRQANAAVALLRLGQPEKVWPLLKHSPDPRVRTYLIHRLGPLGVDAGVILKRLEEEDITIRRALLLSLGEYSEQQLPATARHALLPKLQDIYRTDADPGLHAAAEWLLRHWQLEAWLQEVTDTWGKDKAGREQRLQRIEALLQKDQGKTPPQWYVNGQGQTMVVIPGPSSSSWDRRPPKKGVRQQRSCSTAG